jgi:hypothetical protein
LVEEATELITKNYLKKTTQIMRTAVITKNILHFFEVQPISDAVVLVQWKAATLALWVLLNPMGKLMTARGRRFGFIWLAKIVLPQ